jgi:hypothetical protein
MTDQNTMTISEAVLSSGELEPMTFERHKETTADDLDAVVELLKQVSVAVRAGDLKAFERWWDEGGTEEDDATLFKVREMLLIRYYHREERLRSNTEVVRPEWCERTQS